MVIRVRKRLDNRFAYNRPLSGCVVSKDPGDDNRFIISASEIEFFDQDVSTFNPPRKKVVLAEQNLARPPQLTASTPVVYILVGKDGSIVYQNSDISVSQFPDFLRIGAIYSFDGGATITGAVPFIHDGSDLCKIMHTVGPVNAGLRTRIIGINNTISFYSIGDEFIGLYEAWYTSKKQRASFIFPSSGDAATPAVFVHSDSLGNFSAPRTTLDPTVYDNNGTLTTVPGNNDATIQTVFGSRDGAIVVLYGQAWFTNFQIAERAEREAIVLPNDLQGLPILGRIIIRKDASNILNVNQALIKPVNTFSYSP